MNQNLNELRKKYDQLNEILSLDTENWDPRTKPGIVGKQNAAKKEQSVLKIKLSNEILANSRTILLMRDFEKTKEIIISAKKNPNSNILLDALEIERNLFEELFSEKTHTRNGYTINSDLISRLNILLAAIGRNLGALSMPPVKADASMMGTFTSPKAVIERLETLLTKTFGGELKSLYFGAAVGNGIMGRTDQDSVTVLVVNVTPENAPAFRGFTKDVSVYSNENLETDSQETEEKREYTGKKRGRKTNEERAARALDNADSE